MKRRVILMGGKTYVLSLPSQWVKKYRIQKGEELEIEEKQNSIVIKKDSNFSGKEAEVDFVKLNKMLGRAVGALYKAGYSKVKVKFDSKEQLQAIEETLQRTCIGFEITKQDKNYVIIESISDIKKEEFENSLRRLFFSLEVMGSDLVASKNDSDLKKVIEKDGQVNRLADFCRRVINSGQVNEKLSIEYYIIEQLERIGDLYKKIASTKSLNEDTKKALTEVNKFFVMYRVLFYDFDLEEFENFGKQFNILSEKIKNNNPHIGYLLESIFDMNGALLTKNL